MARTQATGTTPTDTSAPPGVDPAVWAAIQKAMASGGSQTAPQNPIGVPYYAIDPRTGQPYIGPDGQPARWGVNTQAPPDPYQGRSAAESSNAQSYRQQYTLPRYFNGDEWMPASLPPDQLAALQRKMVQAGLMKSGEAQLGVWDTASMNAYTKLLAFANASGLDAGAALDRWGQAHAADPNAGRAPLQIKVSNPDELRQVFRSAVIDKLGQGWDSSQIDQMVNAYQGAETNYQTQAYNQQDTGGTITPPPSPQAYAVQQAQQTDPTGVQEHDVIKPGGPLDAFRQMIGGW